jgi:hypothetical protein
LITGLYDEDGDSMKMKRLTTLGIATLGSWFGAGCTAHRIPESPGAHSGIPQISWSIHAGTAEDPEQLTVCESEPRSECIVGASRPDNPFFASVRLYLHAVSVEATYKGVMQVGFFGGAEPHTVEIDAIVQPGSDPRSVLVYDRLPAKPGVYALEVDLVAFLGPSEDERQIRDRADVTVR